jgi:hypothetical protein
MNRKICTRASVLALGGAALAAGAIACSSSQSSTPSASWTPVNSAPSSAALDWSTSRTLSYATHVDGQNDQGAYVHDASWGLNVSVGTATLSDPFLQIGPATGGTFSMKKTGEVVVPDGQFLIGPMNLLESMPGAGSSLSAGQTWSTRYPSDAEVAAVTDEDTVVFQRQRDFRVAGMWNVGGQIVAQIEMREARWLAKPLPGLSPTAPKDDVYCIQEVNVTLGLLDASRCDVALLGNTATHAQDIASQGPHMRICTTLTGSSNANNNETVAGHDSCDALGA